MVEHVVTIDYRTWHRRVWSGYGSGRLVLKQNFDSVGWSYDLQRYYVNCGKYRRLHQQWEDLFGRPTFCGLCGSPCPGEMCPVPVPVEPVPLTEHVAEK